MIFEYIKAPMHYLDGVPAFKAGEWHGKLSCKFQPTRKVIRPKTEGIIFNENEPPIIPKRRIHSIGPTKEFEFKPSHKMVKPETDKKIKKEGIRVAVPQYTESKMRPERRHYFEHREEHIRELQKRELESNSKVILNDEFRVLNKVGFSKKSLESLPNNKLIGLNFAKDFNQYSFNTTAPIRNGNKTLEKAAKSLWQKKEQDQVNNIRIEKENLKKDVDYVRTLDGWEKSFLPKLK